MGSQVIVDRLVPFQASKREGKRGRNLTWTLRGMPAPPWVIKNWPGSATILPGALQGSP